MAGGGARARRRFEDADSGAVAGDSGVGAGGADSGADSGAGAAGAGDSDAGAGLPAYWFAAEVA